VTLRERVQAVVDAWDCKREDCRSTMCRSMHMHALGDWLAANPADACPHHDGPPCDGTGDHVLDGELSPCCECCPVVAANPEDGPADGSLDERLKDTRAKLVDQFNGPAGALAAEVVNLRAKLAEVERERDAIGLALTERHVEALGKTYDARKERDAASAEVRTLRKALEAITAITRATLAVTEGAK
jgi:hypothetical protein